MDKCVTINFDTGNSGSLNFKEFDLYCIEDNAALAIIAKRRSGKSYFLKQLIKKKIRDYPIGIIISPTDSKTKFFSSFFPDTFIYDEYSDDILKKLFDVQDKLIAKNEIRKAQGKPLRDTRAFLIMDDCMNEKKTWSSVKMIKDMLLIGRHSNILFAFVMQYPLGMGPDLRSNFDYVFLLAEDNHEIIKKTQKNYAGIFPTLRSFKQVFAQLTADYGIMVIANGSANGGTLLDKVFWYKADDLSKETFKVGSSKFRNYHAKNYRKKNILDVSAPVIADPSDFLLTMKKDQKLRVNKLKKK